MDERTKSVLRGCLDNLPTLYSRLVRIFLSSTFTDTREERNILIEDVYPKLKSYCKENHGLEFQVVDMRWGVPEEAADDHLATELCLQEIYNCQELSMGPNFVALLNQRHGYHPLQPSIVRSEFLMLMECLRGMGEDVTLFDIWYKEDENASPPVFVLQPISSIIPEYKNKTQKAGAEWNKVCSEMRRKLRIASQKCFEDGKLQDEDKHKFFISVTEDEIINGILKTPGNPDESCICFVRIIHDIEDNLGHRKAWRFIDMSDGKVDEEAQMFLKKLRDEKVINKLKNSVVSRSEVKWSEDGGINREDHSDYLLDFANTFYTNVKKQLDTAISKATQLSKDELYIEVLQHLTMARERCEMFHGREDILESVTNYLNSDKQEPFTIYGPSGSGKTSIMAEISRKVPFVYNKKAVVLLRFLGTSPDSSNIRRLLQSLCEQIVKNLGEERSGLPEEYDELVALFQDLIQNYKSECPLVILLDSLDQLTSEHSAHKLKWLPKKCSKHVRIVISTYIESEEIITCLRALYSRHNFILVPKLGEELSCVILKQWLSVKNRQLTKEQHSLVENAFSKCSLPLYVKLVFEKVLSWKSYTPLQSCQLVYTIKEIIENLFTRLEAKHGQVYVSRAFAYLTASKSGLSEMELEDIMSLDDILLTEVFRFHVPPIRRVPSVLWARLRYDIDSYLVDKEVDETRVSFWYHRQFLEAAEQRYLGNDIFKKEIHSNIADFFLETWYNRSKPFKYTSDQVKRLGLSSADSTDDRKVSPQPLKYSYTNTEGKTIHRYNKRKLNKMPYHLMMAGRDNELSKLCLFNYSFLVAKVTATSVLQVLTDFLLAGYENSILQKILECSRSSIQRFPTSLAFEISGHLLPFLTDNNVSYEKSLVEECVKVAEKQKDPIPYLTCYKVQSDALKLKLENQKLPYGSVWIAMSKDLKHLLSLTENNRVMLWDLTNGDLEREYEILDIAVCKLNIMEHSVEKNLAYFASSYQKIGNPLVIVDLSSGDIINTLWLEKTYPGVGLVQSLKFLFTIDKIFCLFVGHSADSFDLLRGKHLHHFEFVADEMFLCSNDRKIVFHIKSTNKYVVHSTESYELLFEFEVPHTPLAMMPISRGTESAVIFKDKGICNIINMDPTDCAPGKCLCSIPSTSGKPFQNITISSSGDYLILRTEDGFLTWNYKRNKILHKFVIPASIKPEHRVLSFSGFFTPDNKLFVVGYEYHIVLWNAVSGELLNAQMISRSNLTCNILDNSGDLLVTTSKRNNSIMIWKLSSMISSDSSFNPLSMKTSPRYMAISQTGKVAVVRGNSASEIAILDLEEGNIRFFLSNEYESVRPKITPNGMYAVLREYDSQEAIKIWSTTTGKLVKSLPLSSVHVTHYICSNSRIAVYTKDSPKPGGNISFWNIPDGKMLNTIALGHTNIGDMALLFDEKEDRLLISKQNDGDDITVTDLILMDINSGEELYTIPNIKPARTYTLNIQKFYIITEQVDSQTAYTLVVDMRNQKILHKKCFDPMPVSLSLSADGHYGIDRRLNLYNFESMRLECQFDQGDMEAIRNQEKTVATAPKMMPDGRLAVWVNIKAGLIKIGNVKLKEVQSVCAVHSIPMLLDVSALGLAVVGCEDGRIMILQMPGDEGSDQTTFLQFLNGVKTRLKHQSVKLLKSSQTKRKTNKNSSNGKTSQSNVCEIL